MTSPKALKIRGMGWKVGGLTVALVLVVALMVGWFTHAASMEELIDHERVDLRQETDLRGREVLEMIATLREDVLMLADARALHDLMRSEQIDDTTRADLENVFLALTDGAWVESDADPGTADGSGEVEAPRKPYRQIRLLDADGFELARIDRVSQSGHQSQDRPLYRRVSAAELRNKSDRDYFLELRESFLGQSEGEIPDVYLSRIEYNRAWNEELQSHEVQEGVPVLRAALPVADPQGGLFGLLVINMDFGHVQRMLKLPRHMAYLTDESGHFLVHPDSSLEYGFEEGRSGATIQTMPAIGPSVANFYATDTEHTPWTPADWRDKGLNGFDLAPTTTAVSNDDYLFELEGFRLRQLKLSPSCTSEDREILKAELTQMREELERDPDLVGKVLLSDPDRLQAAFPNIFCRAPLNDPDALRRLDEIQTDLLSSVDGGKLTSAYSYLGLGNPPDCRRFYASFYRLEYDPGNPGRFLGLTMAFSQDELEADLQPAKIRGLLSLILMVVVATLIGVLLSLLVTHPLKVVTQASDSIAGGNFDVSLPLERRDEIGDLARGFQHMIREVRSREQKIEEREVRLRMIVDGAAEGIITIDPGGDIRSANTAASRMFGHENQSLSGGNVQELLAQNCWGEFEFTLKRLLVDGASSGEIPTLDDDSSTFRQLLRNRGARTESLFLESVGRRPDGEEFPIELSLSTVRLPDQRVVTLITRDITQRRLDEEQIQQLNEELELRNETLEQGVRERTAELEAAMLELREARDKAQELAKAKDAFLASVSHELRNPLNQVSGFCQLLELSELDGEQQEDVRKIRVANDQLLALINDILDYQKIIMGGLTLEPQSLNVEDLVGEVQDAMSVLPNPNRNQFYVEWSDDAGTVYADKQRLRQILLNLVGNAWKFTQDGSVHFSASRQHGESGEWIEFSVQDTGRGMTPEEQERLFRPFTKLASRKGNESGTGLGLVISKGLCTLMRGDITLRSEFGKGSCFIIRLPATANDTISDLEIATQIPKIIARAIDESSEPDVPVAASAATTKLTGVQRQSDGDRGRLVLVIDDDPAVREMMQRHLTSHGFEVATAGSGFEGLELARKLNPAVITLDAVMPGLDGWAVLGALKAGEDTSSIPVIMVTVMDKEDRSRALGATEFLPKPIDWEQLTTTLSQYTGDKRDRSILIVDDDTNTREIIRRSLESDGWAVVEAENGKEALERLAEERPAAVLLDLMMPIMDGFEFIVNYSQVAEWLSIPVLVLTAKDPTPEERARLEGQVVRVLRKGDYTHDELLTEIHRRVDRHLKHQLTSQGDEDGADSGR